MNTKGNVVKCYTLIFVFFFSIYFIFQPGHIYSSETAIRYQLMKEGIVLHHHIYTYNSLYKIGRDTVKRGNRYYSMRIGQSILMIPLYYIGKLIGNEHKDETEEFMSSLLNAIFTSLTCLLIFIFGIHLQYKPRISFLLSFIYGFSTFAAIMARDSCDNVETAFFLLLSFYFLHLYSGDLKKKFLVFAGILYGVAVNIRYTPIIILPLLFLFFYMVNRDKPKFLKDSILFILVLLPFITCVLYYNKIIFGCILRTGYENSFGANFLLGIYGLLFSPRLGLIFFAPISILSLWAFPIFFRKLKPLFLLLFLTTLVYVFSHAKYDAWDSGFQFGPRFLLPVLPLLIIPIGFVFKRMKRTVVILSFLGFSLMLPAFFVNHSRYTCWFVDKFVNTKSINSINNFQEIELWKMFPEIVSKMKKGIPWKLSLYSRNLTFKEMIEKSRTMNIFDLWYVQMYYLGFSRKLLMVIVFFFIIIIITTGFLINNTLRNLSANV